MADPAPARIPCGMPCARGPDRPCRAVWRTSRSVARPCRPLVPLGPAGRPAARSRAAGRVPRDRQAAQPKGGRGAKAGGQARAACGGAAKGGHGRRCGGQAPCAAHPTAVDRIPGREQRTRGGACRHAKGCPTGGVKGGKAARGDAKRARRPKIWATATPGRESNLWPSSIYSI